MTGSDPWARGTPTPEPGARWLKNAPQVVALGRATESDTARQLTVVSGNTQILQIGRVTETETAGKLSMAVQIGRVTESDTARTLGVGVDVVAAQLRIAAGAVTSDLTDFVSKIDLSDLPDELWDHFGDDGVYLSIRQDGVEKALDLVNVDPGARTGYGFFKSSLLTAVDNVFDISIRTDPEGQPVETEPTGRNAVWSDYTVMVDFADATDRTGHGHDPVNSGVVGTSYTDSLVLSNMNCWQGIAWDGTYWYGVDNQVIKKFNAAGVVQATVSSTTAIDSRLVHCSGSVVHDGQLFIAISQYPSRLGPMGVAVFNCSDLSFDAFYDISAYVPDASGICWNEDAGCFGVVHGLSSATKVYLFDEDFNHLSDLTPPRSITDVQGITYRDGVYYLMSGPIGATSTIYQVADDMSSASAVFTGGNHLQDLENKGSGTVNLYYGNKSAQLHLLTFVGTVPDEDVGWLNLTGFGYAVITALPKHTTWTMGVTTRLDQVPVSGGQMPLLSYSSFDGNNGNRAVLYGRNTGWTIYNNVDNDLIGSAITSGDINQRRRLHHVQNATTSRLLYLQGVLNATDTGAAQRPGGTDGSEALFLGTEDTDSAEHLLGSLNWAYLRNEALSAAWLAAEQKSWEDNSFYSISIAAEQTVLLGRASETDTARPLTVVRGAVTRALGRVTETDVARTLDLVLAPVSLQLGRVVEVDSPRSLTVLASYAHALDRIQETDLARGLTPALTFNAQLGRVVELTFIRALGLAAPIQRVVETDSARALSLVRSIIKVRVLLNGEETPVEFLGVIHQGDLKLATVSAWIDGEERQLEREVVVD